MYKIYNHRRSCSDRPIRTYSANNAVNNNNRSLLLSFIIIRIITRPGRGRASRSRKKRKLTVSDLKSDAYTRRSDGDRRRRFMDFVYVEKRE